MRLPAFNTIGDQFIKVVLYLRHAPEFIKDNKLWQGYFSIGWISKLCVFIALVFSYIFITGIFGLFSTSTPESADLIQQTALPFMDKLSNFGSSLLLSGSMKYLILILLETVIFHFAVKTQEILTGEQRELTVADFVAAQIRMIKVGFRSWIYELLLSAILIFALKLIGLDILSTVLFFLIQSFFLGHAFIDNYNEQFEIPIKESFNVSYDHLWATIVIGIVAYTLFLIPLIGIIVTPFICAVGATTYMHYAEKDSSIQMA